MSDEIKCGNCTLCCGPVPVNFHELQAIQEELKKKKPREIKRLKNQKRGVNQCMFVDTKRNNCSIYKVRPKLCKDFGYIKGLECPFFPEHAKGKDDSKRPLPVGVLGQSITWDNILI